MWKTKDLSRISEKVFGGYKFPDAFWYSEKLHVEPDILSLAIPMSRFRTMYYTIEKSCLTESHAWEKVKGRIGGSSTN